RRRRDTRALRDWSSDVCSSELECEPSALVAVTVTLYGCSSSPVPDQFQVPSPLSTTPGPATLTASSKSPYVPLLVAAMSSGALRSAEGRVGVGCTSGRGPAKGV